MTDQVPDHTVFDELAAGFVLHTLEPADEQRFLRHAEQCAQCQQTMAEFRMVAAALAETAPPAEPNARLGERIMAVARADLAQPGQPAIPPARSASADSDTARDDRTPPGDGTTADQDTAVPPRPSPDRVVPLRHRADPAAARRRWQRPALAAAAAVLIAVGGIWAGLAATSGGLPQLPAACAHPHACPQVALTSTVTHQTAAKVVIHDGVAWMEPSAIRANPADQIYVLWQVTGAPVPLAVGSFDIKAGTTSPIKIGALPAAYHSTQAFAISLEHGRKIPPRPSTPIAAGKVT
jgi:anti-sigma-K factor RskA